MANRRRMVERHDGRFKDRIRYERLQQGLSQREVAELAAVSLRTYGDWEAGRTVPYPGPQLRRIAYVLRRTPGYLLKGEGA